MSRPAAKADLAALKAYVADRLGFFLGFEDDEMVEQIISLPVPEIESYLSGLLPASSEASSFVSALISKLTALHPPPKVALPTTVERLAAASAPAPKISARPAAARAAPGKDEERLVIDTSQRKKDMDKRAAAAAIEKAAADSARASASAPRAATPASVAVTSASLSIEAAEFVPGDKLKVASAAAATASFRAPASLCNCYGAAHPVFGNCLNCGRIACQAEAAELCGFCGFLFDASVRKGLAGMPHATASAPPVAAGDAATAAASSAAVQHKNKLLLYDRTSASRTHVYDDQADYFNDTSSVWLSPAERKAAAEAAAKHTANLTTRRREMRIQLDFAGRAVVVRDMDAEEEAATKSNLLRLASNSGGVGGRGAGASGKAVAVSTPLATGAPAGHKSEEQVITGGVYANPTLSGRAAEIYASLLIDRANSRRANKANTARPAAITSAASGTAAHPTAAHSHRVLHALEAV